MYNSSTALIYGFWLGFCLWKNQVALAAMMQASSVQKSSEPACPPQSAENLKSVGRLRSECEATNSN